MKKTIILNTKTLGLITISYQINKKGIFSMKPYFVRAIAAKGQQIFRLIDDGRDYISLKQAERSFISRLEADKDIIFAG